MVVLGNPVIPVFGAKMFVAVVLVPMAGDWGLPKMLFVAALFVVPPSPKGEPADVFWAPKGLVLAAGAVPKGEEEFVCPKMLFWLVAGVLPNMLVWKGEALVPVLLAENGFWTGWVEPMVLVRLIEKGALPGAWLVLPPKMLLSFFSLNPKICALLRGTVVFWPKVGVEPNGF